MNDAAAGILDFEVIHDGFVEIQHVFADRPR